MCLRRFAADDMTLRVAVIGVGHLGKHHARILAALPGVTLTSVVDTNQSRAQEIAAAHGAEPAYHYRDVLGRVDAVTIAVPTELHAEIAAPFLQTGVPVLVEKPMARTLGEADAMISAADVTPSRTSRYSSHEMPGYELFSPIGSSSSRSPDCAAPGTGLRTRDWIHEKTVVFAPTPIAIDTTTTAESAGERRIPRHACLRSPSTVSRRRAETAACRRAIPSNTRRAARWPCAVRTSCPRRAHGR